MRHPPYFQRVLLIVSAGALAAPAVFGATAAVAADPGAAPGCGRFIAYSVVLEGSLTSYDLLAIPAAGDEASTALYTGPTAELDPQWSPDGRRLAFASRGEDTTGPRHIWVMRPGRTEPRQLTTFSAGNNRYPTWSPDGSQLAYTTGVVPGDPTRLRVTNADGTDDHEVFGIDGATLEYARWSPDGTRIVFTIVRDAFTRFDVGMIDADGSGFVALTDDGRSGYADWVSNESLVFVLVPESGHGSDVYIADDQLQDPQRVTHLPGHIDTPEVSPSGKRVVFDNWGRGFDQLTIARLDRRGTRVLADDPGSYAYPAWQSRARCS